MIERIKFVIIYFLEKYYHFADRIKNICLQIQSALLCLIYNLLANIKNFFIKKVVISKKKVYNICVNLSPGEVTLQRNATALKHPKMPKGQQLSSN